MSIILCTDDLPLGVTTQEAACLVLGAERVNNDVMILVRSETDHTYAWEESMRKRLVTDPTPEVERIVRGMDHLLTLDPTHRAGPPVSHPPAIPLSAPADYASVASANVDYRGITFGNLAIEAAERGLTLTDVAAAGFKLANGHGCIVRKSLADLAPIIRSTHT